MLQADSEKLRQAWVQAVQASIASAYRESPDSCYSEVGPPGVLQAECRHTRAWCVRTRACVRMPVCAGWCFGGTGACVWGGRGVPLGKPGLGLLQG